MDGNNQCFTCKRKKIMLNNRIVIMQGHWYVNFIYIYIFSIDSLGAHIAHLTIVDVIVQVDWTIAV